MTPNSKDILDNFDTLAYSEAFMKLIVPELLTENKSILKELYLAAIKHPHHSKNLESIYRGHKESGKI